MRIWICVIWVCNNSGIELSPQVGLRLDQADLGEKSDKVASAGPKRPLLTNESGPRSLSISHRSAGSNPLPEVRSARTFRLLPGCCGSHAPPPDFWSTPHLENTFATGDAEAHVLRRWCQAKPPGNIRRKEADSSEAPGFPSRHFQPAGQDHSFNFSSV